MRAGAFSDPRVIDLLNRRFVSYYFNTGGPGEGHNDEAKAFVAEVENQYAFYAAFLPDGTYLGSSEIYADKTDVFEFLKGLLEKHPDYGEWSEEEEDLLSEGSALQQAQLYEETADYERAEELYAEVVDEDESSLEAASFGLARIARYRGDWNSHKEALARIRSGEDETVIARVALEDGYRLLAEKKYTEAREKLQECARRYEDDVLAAELHFYAGIACWFEEDADWARFHWVWIMENREDDRLYMRARVAAADDAMHYPNTELGRPEIRKGQFGVAISQIDEAVSRSRAIYNKLLPLYDNDVFQSPSSDESQSAEDLVALLRDGNDFVPHNNSVFERLEGKSKDAVPALCAALSNREFQGRGAASWALGHILAGANEPDNVALAALEACAKDEDEQVRAQAQASLALILSPENQLIRLRKIEPQEAFAMGGDVDVAGLVLKLRDGNEYRVENNVIVDRLKEIGEVAIDPLIRVIEDPDSKGRGYAAWALANVMASCGTKPSKALTVLESCTQDADPYVVALSRSGKRVLGEIKAKAAVMVAKPSRSAFMLVSGLIDGNEHRIANNALVDDLIPLGDGAVLPLIAAIRDPAFPGRGYAAWALGSVLAEMKERPQEAIQTLREAGRDEDSYVRTLARSGLSLLR